MLEYDHETGNLQAIGYTVSEAGKFTERGIMNAYLDIAAKESEIEDDARESLALLMGQKYSGQKTFAQQLLKQVAPVTFKPPEYLPAIIPVSEDAKRDDTQQKSQFVGKKYKPVAQKIRPVFQDLPEKYRIKRDIVGNPLADMPALSTTPVPFIPTGRYTAERKEQFDEVHKGEFLWPAERNLMHNLMMLQNGAFAWEDDEKGRFREEFFPPVEIPVIEHKPWVLKNIPIPPGLQTEVCRILRGKISNGIIEPSNAPYRTRWFTVLKKNGSLRVVHSLEPLNAVTIAHSGVPPITDELAIHFSGRACGGMFDLYVGYDERLLAESSRDLTTFQTPFGAMRLVTLPMGWTNSVPIFHDDVNFILQDEVPEYTMPYIDDVPVRGPASRYQKTDGSYETIADNSGIRRFVWEHMNNVNRILQRMKYSGGTFSGHKSLVCANEITVVGHVCSYEGRKPAPDKLAVINNWGACKNVSDVRAFLGTLGLLRIFIPNYAKRAQHISKLLKNSTLFEWGPDQEESMQSIKDGLSIVPFLKTIDYDGQGDVVLAVDTSYKAVGYYIYQKDIDDPKKKHYVRFGSIPLNDREANFSQPKRELFGMMRALHACRHWLIGVRKLVVETDASYISGMLVNPDLMPNATINRWLENIKLFHFTLVHKKGATFGPDGLSRRPHFPGDEEYSNPDEDEEKEEPPPNIVMDDPMAPLPFDVKDFVDEIDKRKGFFNERAKSVEYFQTEIKAAIILTQQECKELRTFLMKEKPRYSQHIVAAITSFTNVISRNLLPELKDNQPVIPDVEYPEHLRTKIGIEQDAKCQDVTIYLKNQILPAYCDTSRKVKNFKRWTAHFFLDEEGRLYRRSNNSQHRLVVNKIHRMYMMKAAHDSLGHRGVYSTKNLLAARFWWPELERDVVWYIKTCQFCQERQRTLLKIPSVVTHTPSVFQVVHCDTMNMTPASNGHKYIVHGRCHLTSWPEARALKNENGDTIGKWLFEEIITRWGCMVEIVTDNGPPFIKAVKWLADKYGIQGIRISPYNSRANGTIERPHWDIRQMLYKATDGEIAKWFWFLYHVLWADRISIRKRLGCSPFFMVTAAHPIIPLDVLEATWLVKLPGRVLTDAELIGFRAQALSKQAALIDNIRAKVTKAKIERLLKYEKDHKAVIKDFDFKPGNLVLVRNTGIESSLDKKMKARYLGPMVVIRRTTGGSYIVAELNGALWSHKVAQFRVLPYFARSKITLPDNLLEWLSVTKEGLQKVLEAAEPDESENYAVQDIDALPLPVPDDDDDSDSN